MPTFALLLAVEAENIATIARSASSPYLVQFKCSRCGETTRSIAVDSSVQVEVPGSRGYCNLVYTCKGCEGRSSVTVQTESRVPADHTHPAALATLEIRGSIAPIAWTCNAFDVEAEGSGTPFWNAAHDDFCDFDDPGDQQVALLSCTHTIA